MAAQDGASVVLTYGAQGSQQPGDAVVLDYAASIGTRRLAARMVAPWSAAAILRDHTAMPMPKSIEVIKRRIAPWVGSRTLRTDDGGRWDAAAGLARRGAAPWGRYERHQRVGEGVPWGVAARRNDSARAPWGRFERRLQIGEGVSWGMAARQDESAAAPWGGPLRAVQPGHLVLISRSAPADQMRHVPWVRYSTNMAPTWGIVIPIQDPSAPPEAFYIVPVRRFYMAINSIELRKVDGDVALPAYAFGMSLDVDSWTWSFTATLRKDALAHVRRPAGADPVEIEATVNGVPYRLRIERVGREANFPATRIRVSGRGLAATLASPYAPAMTFGNPSAARTAQQLANDVLTVNGVPLGWTVDWQLTDWLVPAGAWTFQGSYVEAINDIAAAAGGYVQPHPTAATLRVLPRYPSAPWTWATAAPDVELPAAAVEVESTDWVDKPAYNRVFVGGLAQGVFGPVTRTGTAGDLVAPQVAHALITAPDAQRQRGLAVLADTGSQAQLQLKLPVLAETGLILPGQMVRYLGDDTAIGIVRRTGLDWSTPVMRQTIGVETHAA